MTDRYTSKPVTCVSPLSQTRSISDGETAIARGSDTTVAVADCLVDATVASGGASPPHATVHPRANAVRNWSLHIWTSGTSSEHASEPLRAIEKARLIQPGPPLAG